MWTFDADMFVTGIVSALRARAKSASRDSISRNLGIPLQKQKDRAARTPRRAIRCSLVLSVAVKHDGVGSRQHGRIFSHGCIAVEW